VGELGRASPPTTAVGSCPAAAAAVVAAAAVAAAAAVGQQQTSTSMATNDSVMTDVFSRYDVTGMVAGGTRSDAGGAPHHVATGGKKRTTSKGGKKKVSTLSGAAAAAANTAANTFTANLSTPLSKGSSAGKRKRSASKKMIEAEEDAAFEQTIEMQRREEKRQSKQSKHEKKGKKGRGKKNKGVLLGGGRDGTGSESSPFHPRTGAKTLPGLGGSSGAISSPEAEMNKRRQLQKQAKAKKAPPKPTVTIADTNPNRITNPLLSLPLYPRGVSGPNGTSTAAGASRIAAAARVAGMMGDSGDGAKAGGGGIGAAGPAYRPDLIPNGGEMWNVMELYDPKVIDTFPIGYLARLLGFDVPHSVPQSDVVAAAEKDVANARAAAAREQGSAAKTGSSTDEGKKDEKVSFDCFDPATAQLIRRDEDVWMNVPDLGQFVPMIRMNKRRKQEGDDDDADTDFFDMDVMDPMWRAILSDKTLTRRGADSNDSVKLAQAEEVSIPSTAEAFNPSISVATEAAALIAPASSLTSIPLSSSTAASEPLVSVPPPLSAVHSGAAPPLVPDRIDATIPTNSTDIGPSRSSRLSVPITFGIGQNVKLATGSFYHFISEHCLNCVKEIVGGCDDGRGSGSHSQRPAPVEQFDERIVNLLREGRVTFRLATSGDEGLLQRLNTNRTRFHSADDYALALRSGHFFIIAMENLEGTERQADDKRAAALELAPLGYIHYTFCWYKLGQLPSDEGRSGTAVSAGGSSDATTSLYGVSSSAASLRPPTVSELVFCMDEIQCTANCLPPPEIQKKGEESKEKRDDGNPTQEGVGEENSSTGEDRAEREQQGPAENDVGCEMMAIILVALALEHVRGNDIWYGILDLSTSSEMNMLKKFFRMTPLETDRDTTTVGPKSLSFPMACDVKRCSFRFAFLRYLDEVRRRRSLGPGGGGGIGGVPGKDMSLPSLRQRMLVRLPSAEVVAACQKSSSPMQTPMQEKATTSALTSDATGVGTGTSVRLDTSETLPAGGGDREPAFQAPRDANRTPAVGLTPSSAPATGSTVSPSTTPSAGPLEKAGLYFTSADEKVRSKAVGIRIDLLNVTSTQPKVQLLSMASDESTQLSLLNAGVNSNAGDSFDQIPKWQVLKTFALPSPSAESSTAAPSPSEISNDADARKSSSKPPTHDGTILSDLLRKQAELRRLESGMEPKLRHLLTKTYQERLDNEDKALVEKRTKINASVSKYEAIIKQRREADAAWQAQLEQDMDAVCDICGDGDVSVDNQILFCEACNVAVHQKCYGIPRVPEGDYFCNACRHYGRDKIAAEQASRFALSAGAKRPKHKPLPISCEACPRKQGAFLRTMEVGEDIGPGDDPTKAKWIHVTCAKWMGLDYIDHGKTDAVESVQDLKASFHDNYVQCYLCESERGCFNRCNETGCERWIHVTCARSSGLCRVIHGENSMGSIESDRKWKLWCPEHSGIEPEDIPGGSLSIEQLKAAANAFPPEPRRPPPPKSFGTLAGEARAKFWGDRQREKEMIELLMGRVEGARCAVCNVIDSNEFRQGRTTNKLATCASCGIVVHRNCYMGQAPRGEKEFVCQACVYINEKQDEDEYENPQCHMCNLRGGVLRKAFAKPTSMKRFKANMKKFKQTLFGKQIWCHTVCAMWHPKIVYDEYEDVDCSQLVMANGLSHIDGKHRCDLCGRKDKVKLACSMKECHESGGKLIPYRFHVTCARQAGLDVHDEDESNDVAWPIKCFHHVRCEEVLRAKMEDMIEVEKKRAGKSFQKSELPMSFTDASRLMHWSINILANLGWAWKWADWWVEQGDNWEPLIEMGQKEKDMTSEQLKIVKSTPQSRCEDARRCRLAAFGAALRNRDYDKEDGDDKVALDNALRVILSTPSLVGPLKAYEIDFFAEWLGRAYRSKSPLLGFGDDRIPIDETVCVHIEDGSPKYELGSRSLPGKHAPDSKGAETEVDDFLRTKTRDKEESAGRDRGQKRSNSAVDSLVEPPNTAAVTTGNLSTKVLGGSTDEDPIVKPSLTDSAQGVEKKRPAKRGKKATNKMPPASPTGKDGEYAEYPRRRGRGPQGKTWNSEEGTWVQADS